MKRIFYLTLVFAFLALNCWSQVTWQFSAKKIADKTYEIHLRAEVAEPWHIYSQNTSSGGPIPAKIIYNANPIVTISGKTREKGDLQIKYEEIFGIDVMFYEDTVKFVQIVKLKSEAKTNVTGEIEYMICNDRECMPPSTIKFNIKLE